MPLGIGGSNYWSPGSSVTGAYDWGNTPWGSSIMEQNKDVAFYRYGREIGVPDDQSGFSRWFRQRYPEVNTGFGAYTVSNPLTANIVDYLHSLGGMSDWQRKYRELAPQLRGENPSGFGAGPTRWVNR